MSATVRVVQGPFYYAGVVYHAGDTVCVAASHADLFVTNGTVERTDGLLEEHIHASEVVVTRLRRHAKGRHPS